MTIPIGIHSRVSWVRSRRAASTKQPGPHSGVEGGRTEQHLGGTGGRHADHREGCQRLGRAAPPSSAGDEGTRDGQPPGDERRHQPDGEQGVATEHVGRPGEEWHEGRMIDVPSRRVLATPDVVDSSRW